MAELLGPIGVCAAHEFGHFLGLDHQFDKKFPSIMSYAGVEEITEYDREAVAALYSEANQDIK